MAGTVRAAGPTTFAVHGNHTYDPFDGTGTAMVQVTLTDPGGPLRALGEVQIVDWQSQAEQNIRRNVGYVPGVLTHFWHGKKKDRKYWDRWQILVRNQFNPRRDVKRDAQGLLQLVDHGDLRSIQLRDELRDYFRQRSEDSIDI